MWAILATILPVFLLIIFGYGIGRSGFLSVGQVQGLGRYVIGIALPALLFQSLRSHPIGEVIQFDYLLIYALGSLCVYAVIFAWFRNRGANLQQSAVRAFGAACSNAGLIGLPIMVQLFGPKGAIPVALNMLVENVVTTPLTLSLLHAAGRKGRAFQVVLEIAGKLCRTPLVIAILAGIVFSLFSIPIPSVLARPIMLLAQSAPPVALIAIGAGLRSVPARHKQGDIAIIALGKLAMHPLLIASLLFFFPLADANWQKACLVLASMPMVSIFPIIAAQANDEEVCGSALFIATALSFFSIPLAIWASGADVLAGVMP